MSTNEARSKGTEGEEKGKKKKKKNSSEEHGAANERRFRTLLCVRLPYKYEYYNVSSSLALGLLIMRHHGGIRREYEDNEGINRRQAVIVYVVLRVQIKEKRWRERERK
jgi:hypothetical protein